MVFLNGIVYQIKADGTVLQADDSIKIPFASVVNFKPQINKQINLQTTIEEFYREADSLLPTKNYFYAIKVTGIFDSIITRSVPRQQKPYKQILQKTNLSGIFQMSFFRLRTNKLEFYTVFTNFFPAY